MASIDFDEIRQKASETAVYIAGKSKEIAKYAAEKGKLLAKIARLKNETAKEKEATRHAYRELGRRYYEKHGDNPAEEFRELCEAISASQTIIAANAALISELKTELKENGEEAGYEEFEEAEQIPDAPDETGAVAQPENAMPYSEDIDGKTAEQYEE